MHKLIISGSLLYIWFHGSLNKICLWKFAYSHSMWFSPEFLPKISSVPQKQQFRSAEHSKSCIWCVNVNGKHDPEYKWTGAKKKTVYVKITVCKYCLSAPRFENFMSKETCTHKKKEEKFWLSTNRNFNTSNKCQSYRIINTVWCYNFKFFVRHWVCSTFRNFRNPSKLYPWWPKGLANFNIWDV
jgi:hypothetical protein